MLDPVHDLRLEQRGRSRPLREPAGPPHGARPAPFDVVAVAASMGGLHALTEVLTPLPADFPAAVIVVQHLRRAGHSLLASLLDQRTRLPVREAAQGAPLGGGVIHVARPDWHLRVSERKTLCLSGDEPVHFTRPAADPLFQSAAAVFKERAIAVVLTGRGEDGAVGVRAIKSEGRIVISQHPDGCSYVQMPRAALRTGCVDLCLALRSIAPALVTLIMVPGAPQFFGLPLRASCRSCPPV